MRCQLNKGIRNLLKSKSQSNYRKVNKRQPLSEVNNNVADSTVSNQTPNPDQANVEPAGEDATHINILAHANNFLDNTSLNLHHNAHSKATTTQHPCQKCRLAWPLIPMM